MGVERKEIEPGPFFSYFGSFGIADTPQVPGHRTELTTVDLTGREMGLGDRLSNIVNLHGMEYVIPALVRQFGLTYPTTGTR